jgi:hypothetical protein
MEDSPGFQARDNFSDRTSGEWYDRDRANPARMMHEGEMKEIDL